jgi:hypothetical protein
LKARSRPQLEEEVREDGIAESGAAQTAAIAEDVARDDGGTKRSLCGLQRSWTCSRGGLRAPERARDACQFNCVELGAFCVLLSELMILGCHAIQRRVLAESRWAANRADARGQQKNCCGNCGESRL